MKALVLTAPNHLELREVPVPMPGPREVLVRVAACGICGSDVHGLDGSTGRRQPPIIMGHEAAGVIAAVGRDVDGWCPGDRVTFDSTVYCGVCLQCFTGKVNLCDKRRVLGVSCDEYRQDGAFSEFVVVPERCLYAVPGGVPLTHAALAEPLSVAAHAVFRARAKKRGTALVIGAGTIGLMVVLWLRASGAKLIIAADLNPARLELARAMGAHEILDARADDLPAAVAALTEGHGVEHVFEAAGLEATVGTAVRCARKGGAVVLIGNVTPQVSLPLQTAVSREITLFGSCASAGEYPQCLDLMARGEVDVSRLISAVAPLEEGPAWFQRLQAGEPDLLKVILTPNGSVE